MKKLLVLGLLAGLLLTGCNRGEIDDDLQVDYTVSALFDEDEREAAVRALKAEFVDSFEDCTLHAVRYAGDKLSKAHGDYYGHDTAMKFYIDYSTGFHASPVLNPNSEYPDWQILMYQDEAGRWQIDYAGCGYG